jgi:hypothetical protein
MDFIDYKRLPVAPGTKNIESESSAPSAVILFREWIEASHVSSFKQSYERALESDFVTWLESDTSM